MEGDIAIVVFADLVHSSTRSPMWLLRAKLSLVRGLGRRFGLASSHRSRRLSTCRIPRRMGRTGMTRKRKHGRNVYWRGRCGRKQRRSPSFVLNSCISLSILHPSLMTLAYRRTLRTLHWIYLHILVHDDHSIFDIRSGKVLSRWIPEGLKLFKETT